MQCSLHTNWNLVCFLGFFSKFITTIPSLLPHWHSCAWKFCFPCTQLDLQNRQVKSKKAKQECGLVNWIPHGIMNSQGCFHWLFCHIFYNIKQSRPRLFRWFFCLQPGRIISESSRYLYLPTLVWKDSKTVMAVSVDLQPKRWGIRRLSVLSTTAAVSVLIRLLATRTVYSNVNFGHSKRESI